MNLRKKANKVAPNLKKRRLRSKKGLTKSYSDFSVVSLEIRGREWQSFMQFRQRL